MDINNLTRATNITEITNNIKPSGKGFAAQKDMLVYIPVEYEAKKLLEIGDGVISSIGCVGVVVGSKYGCMRLPTTFKTLPNAIRGVKIKDVDYYELSYASGDMFMEQRDIAMSPALVDAIIGILIFKGSIPWYMEPDDIVGILTNIGQYTGMDVDDMPEVMELLTGIIIRDDTGKLLRYKDEYPENVNYIGINNAVFSSTSSFRRMIGNHQVKGIRASLNTDSDNISNIEIALRK